MVGFSIGYCMRVARFRFLETVNKAVKLFFWSAYFGVFLDPFRVGYDLSSERLVRKKYLILFMIDRMNKSGLVYIFVFRAYVWTDALDD